MLAVMRGLCACLCVVIMACSSGPRRESAMAGDDYRLMWADEFDVAGRPDPQNWNFEHGFVRNQELQWYQSENAFVADGRLIIEGRREERPNPNYDADSDDWRTNRPTITYTSASLRTLGLQQWKYGRFEVRAKIPASDGMWPAIWFLGVEGEWPSSGEIDLMEYYDGNILANACWGTQKRYEPKWDSVKVPLGDLGDPQTWDQEFHIWRMDWDEQSIVLSLDDRVLNTIDLTTTINPNDHGPGNPFHQPHYLLLNLAMGGLGGDPAGTDFPARYEIDYVRVYQRERAVD